MSWTAHRECALEFAQGITASHLLEIAVYRATISERAILAAFADDREQECVGNPNMLRGRVMLDEVIPADSLDGIVW